MIKTIWIIAARTELKSKVNLNRVPQRMALEIENTQRALVSIITAESPIIDAHLDRCDAIILPWWADIDPTLYWQENQWLSLNPYKPNDQFLIDIVKKASHRKMPLLGICKWMQIINVAFGWNLHQDLSNADFHKQWDKPYEITHNIETLDEKTQRDMLRGRVLSSERIFWVNSLHHQWIDKLWDWLEILGKCTEDGLIEVISDGNYIIWVQWHPEYLISWEELLNLLGI